MVSRLMANCTFSSSSKFQVKASLSGMYPRFRVGIGLDKSRKFGQNVFVALSRNEIHYICPFLVENYDLPLTLLYFRPLLLGLVPFMI